MSDNREFELEWRKVLENFIGYGDPDKADYFFFGLEEKDKKSIDPSCKELEQDRLEFYRKTKANFSNNKYYWIDTKLLYNLIPEAKELDEKPNKTLSNIAKLSYKLIGENIEQIEIGSSDHKIFNGNIFSFPKEKHELQEELTDNRRELLKSFFNEKILNKNKTLITFGKVHLFYKIILEIFDDVKFSSPKYKSKSGKKPYYYLIKNAKNTIYILPHACSFWNDNFLDEVFNENPT